jgi:hypothetical protein
MQQTRRASSSGRVISAVPIDSATVRIDLRRLSRSLSRWSADPDVPEISGELAGALCR